LIIFYGSQTGTGEDYAQRLGKECKKRFNIQPMVADLENYDLGYLDTLPKETIAVFVISTYGEGDPTDSAVNFWELLNKDVPTFSKGCAVDRPLQDLRYLVFGLGNRTYEYFNGAAIGVDKQLTQLGGTRIGEVGLGDDDLSLEDDFMQWQDQVWPLLADALVKTTADTTDEQQQQQHAYKVMMGKEDGSFYYKGELGDTQQSTWSVKRPYPAPVKIHDLTPNSRDQRHCLHVDVDLAGSDISYTTGDHLGIWPTNNEDEVSLVSTLFGYDDAFMDQVISVIPTDSTTKLPFPQPTTLRAALRHYLDIAQLPSRSTIDLLIPHCSDQSLKSFLQNLVDDKNEHKRVVLDQVRNLGQLISFALAAIGHKDASGALKDVPVEVVLECYSRLQPRYYSISSSSSESGTVVSATAVTLKYNPTPDRTVYGVNTNYLWAIHETLSASSLQSDMPKYAVEGPRQQYLIPDATSPNQSQAKIPVHIRKSTFRLPSSSSTPIIMVGPGTGVAPFRGFVRERVYQKQVLGENVGATVLFFGCRRSTEDYLYADEWPGLFKSLDNSSSRIITAFSRESSEKKVYVQQRLAEHGQEMWDLLANQGAYFYVCGDAKYMAKDVLQTVMDMAKSFGGLGDEEATTFIQDLRKSNRYVEDVWA
jgi:NADPH-ferrihemoprotein reductase